MYKRINSRVDIVIVMALLLLFFISILALFSASKSQEERFGFNFAHKQALWFCIGMVVFLIILLVSYQRCLDVAYILYAANIIALIVIFFSGSVRYGAQRWISLGGFMVQPSEFMKFSCILTFAHYLGGRRENLATIKDIVVPLILVGIPFLLVLAQPDLGTALSLLPIFFSMIYVAGVPAKIIFQFTAFGVFLSPFAWQLLKEYQKRRLLVFIDPNVDPLGAGYTIIQSKIAIGSGGFLGKGWLSGTQNRLNFLPERHTDFIFSVIGEEWGFVGSAIVVLLFFIMLYRCLSIAKETTDMFGRLIIAGVTSMIAFQVFINICMTIGLMPVVGLPLPLISYGGSSLIVSLASLGLVLSVHARKYQ